MKVIVTDNDVVYPTFLKVDSVEKIKGIVANTINVLVIHKNQSDSRSVALVLTSDKRIKKVLYVSSPENVDHSIQMAVVANGGSLEEDEFYLEDEEDLEQLIATKFSSKEVEVRNGASLLEGFLRATNTGQDVQITPKYLETVRDAVNAVLELEDKSSKGMAAISKAGNDLTVRTTESLLEMQKQLGELKDTLQSVKSTGGGLIGVRKPLADDDPYFGYIPVSYNKPKKVILIKQLGNVPFLVSFMLGFRSYLMGQNTGYVPKFLFIVPQGKMYVNQYREYQIVSKQTAGYKQFLSNDVCFTSIPDRERIDYFLSDDDRFSVYVVVDLTKTGTGHAIKSQLHKTVYAVSGATALEKHKLGAKDMYFSSIMEVPGAMFCLNAFQTYPIESHDRLSLYVSNAALSYNLLLRKTVDG